MAKKEMIILKKSLKKLLASLLVAVMVLSVAPVGALTEIDLSSLFAVEASALTSGSYTYTVSGSNATITAYSGTASTLSIPSTLGGYTVTAIGPGAFANNTSLISVSIPSTVTRISDTGTAYGGAFWQCTKLQKVTIAKGTKDAEIGFKTFYGCTSLQSISIPGNYTRIYDQAFYNCKSLKSLEWEKSGYVYANQSIGTEAFVGCSSLEKVTLPTTLNVIGDNAFSSCGIINLIIPEGVTVIGKGAFSDNNSLLSVSIPSTVTRISDTGTAYGGAFWQCTKLQKVTIAKGTKDAEIGFKTFYGCTSLQSISIPGNYTRIYDQAFYNCKSLKSLEWEKSGYVYANQSIGTEAFVGCSSLEKVTLPTTLNIIGDNAFSSCGIVNLVIPEGVTVIGKGAFSDNNSLISVSIPSTVIRISDTGTAYGGAFWYCTNLETVIFEEGSKDLHIGYKTFYGCSKLKTLHLPLNLKSIYSECFVNTSSNLTICSKSNSSYGKTYADNNSIKFKLCNGSHTTTPTTTYTITYNANGGSISPSSVSVKAGESVSLPIPSAKTYTITYNANGGSGAPSAQSFAVACKGWSTSSTATSASYACGTKYTPTKNVTLYAVWNNATDATVSTKIPMRAGYSFRGWSTVSNATTPTVGVGSEWSITSNITLYAVWEKISTPTPSYKEENVSMNYKDTMTVNGAVSVETSNSGVASVSGNKITAADTGSADVTVTYEDGSVCVYHINVSYSWWQWIIVIVLFGWIWY